MSYAVEVEGLSKAYRIFPNPAKRVIEAASFGRFKGHNEFWALRDVNFKLQPGSSIGLCGANGAGKSTLMKVLSGITPPTQGRYRINGRVASLLELGAGFHMEFTGRANIVMNGVMMGLTKREIMARMDQIIEFAELGPYIDEPVRTYSSGMGLRLAFAIAVAVEPEVLIIDEVFAVGDMYFQKKCIDKIYEFKQQAKTILFCSHSLFDVRQLCDEALWLDKGNTMAQGDSVYVTNEYAAFQRNNIDEAKEYMGEQYGQAETGPGIELPSIVDARVYRLGTDEECYEYKTGDSFEIRVWWNNPDPQKTPIHLGVGFMRQDLTLCGAMVTHIDGVEIEGQTGCTVLRVPDCQLFSGQFLIPVILFDEGAVHKYQEYMIPDNIVVRNDTRELGLFRLDHDWEHSQRPAPEKAEPAEPTEEKAPA